MLLTGFNTIQYAFSIIWRWLTFCDSAIYRFWPNLTESDRVRFGKLHDPTFWATL